MSLVTIDAHCVSDYGECISVAVEIGRDRYLIEVEDADRFRGVKVFRLNGKEDATLRVAD